MSIDCFLQIYQFEGDVIPKKKSRWRVGNVVCVDCGTVSANTALYTVGTVVCVDCGTVSANTALYTVGTVVCVVKRCMYEGIIVPTNVGICRREKYMVRDVLKKW